MQLHEIMRTGVITIGPTETASVAWTTMKRRRIHHLVVVAKAGITGILSERDLHGSDNSGRLVRDLMSRRVVSAGPETTLTEAADLMLARRIGCLPVVDDGRLVGIVTATDVLDELSRETRSPHETPGSRKREPFPAQLPRSLKPITGRARPALVPAHVRVLGVSLSEESKADIRRKLGTKLGKFAASVERVSVRVKDVNGPRGGVDQLCRVKVVLSGFPSVVFEHQDRAPEVAIDGALTGAERAVRKALQRGRTKPLKAGRARASVQAD
ncbi:MAG: CBS domain-containing protein [Bryobacterales bacterium]|nr:CBS domain-containing protein [Bryobacterales bacterium]